MQATRKERLYEALVSLGAGLAGLAPIILLVEIVEWLASGQWPGWSVEDGLMFVGLEKPLAYFNATQFALDILVSLPLALALYALGFLMFSWAMNAADRVLDR